jgi:hypothetical protein
VEIRELLAADRIDRISWHGNFGTALEEGGEPVLVRPEEVSRSVERSRRKIQRKKIASSNEADESATVREWSPQRPHEPS